MRYLLRISFFLGLALFFSTCAPDKPVSKYTAQNIFVVIVDGARWSETWGDSAGRLIPHRLHELRPQGVYFSNFRNTGYTYTSSGHTAICTGFRQPIDNTGQELPDYPSFMQYWLKATGAPSDKAWVVTSKDKLAVLANCKDTDWKDQYMPMTDCGVSGLGSGYREDSITLQHIRQVISAHHPHLMLVNLREPDFSAHTGVWANYLAGIRSTDAYVAELWNLLQSDPQYAGKTALFITNDHGRHLDAVVPGFTTHGDGCEGCRHIELIALGPDFRAGSVISGTYGHEDLTATIDEMLGIRQEHGEGKLIKELFR